MTKIILSSVLSLIAATVHAAPDLGSLVKITKENNPGCVEYYHYGRDLYCSTTKLQPNQSLTLDQIKASEKQHLIVDNRLWQPVWAQQTKAMTTIEYLPAGDSLDHWQELITSQFIPYSINPLTPQHYLEIFINNLKQTGLTPKMTIHEQSPTQIIFEFQIDSPSNLQQDELQKVTQTEQGLYLLHYVMKKNDMGKEKRQEWIKNLKASSI